jgi:hypothetical protein
MKKVLLIALFLAMVCVAGLADKTDTLDVTLNVLKHSEVELSWVDGNTGIFTWDPAVDPGFLGTYQQYANCVIKTNSKLKVTTGFDEDYLYGSEGKGIEISHMSNSGSGTPYTNEVFGDYEEIFPFNALGTAGLAEIQIKFELYKDGEWNYWDLEYGSKTVTYTITVENQD